MELSILELFLNASIVVKSVIILLLLASITSWIVIFERWLYVNRVSQDFSEFEERFWSDSGLEALLSISQEEGHQSLGSEYIFQVGFLDIRGSKKRILTLKQLWRVFRGI